MRRIKSNLTFEFDGWMDWGDKISMEANLIARSIFGAGLLKYWASLKSGSAQERKPNDFYFTASTRFYLCHYWLYFKGFININIINLDRFLEKKNKPWRALWLGLYGIHLSLQDSYGQLSWLWFKSLFFTVSGLSQTACQLVCFLNDTISLFVVWFDHFSFVFVYAFGAQPIVMICP